MGYNLEITRPNDKKTEKKFKLEVEARSVRGGKCLVAEWEERKKDRGTESL